MNHKSIISLISFFFLSMFYVAPASAGPLYLNVEVPKKCGAWKLGPNAHYCSVRGPSSGNGGKVDFKCVGGGNGKGTAVVDTKNCGVIAFGTAVKEPRRRGDWALYKVHVAHGKADPISGHSYDPGWSNYTTHTWRVRVR
jgi:hypothetical protein